MVDIIKSLPHVPTSFSSHVYNLRSKPFCQQIKLPIYLSNPNENSQNNRINNIHTKRWIGKFPANPPRLLDVSNTPYSIHRKVMYQELSRYCPSTVDLSRSVKSKQQRNTTKDTTKITTSTTTLGSEKTNITSQPSFSYGDSQSSRLFDTLSKHVTVKPEPLRPSNNLTNNAANTLTSWQRYWTSTHVQRRRKETNDPQPVLYRPKREQRTPGQTHFVVLRPSPYPYSDLNQDDNQKPSTPPKTTSSSTKQYNSSPTPGKQISSTKDDNINKGPNQISTVSTIEFLASSLIPSSIEINSSIIPPKTSTIISSKSTDRDDEKYFTDKSLLLSLSSYFKSDSQIIEDGSQAQIQSKPITTKFYKFSLPSAKPKTRKKSPPTRRARSKSVEKKQTRISSASERKRQISTNPKSTLSSVITTTSISKYSQTKWTEPYVGLRFDPPAPPCSPSLLTWLKDNDQKDNDRTFEQSKLLEHNLTGEILDS